MTRFIVGMQATAASGVATAAIPSDLEAQETDPLLKGRRSAAQPSGSEEIKHTLGKLTEEIAQAYSEVIPASQHSHGVGSVPMGE